MPTTAILPPKNLAALLSTLFISMLSRKSFASSSKAMARDVTPARTVGAKTALRIRLRATVRTLLSGKEDRDPRRA